MVERVITKYRKDWNLQSFSEKCLDDAFAPDEELDCLSVDDIVTERDRSDKIMATYEGQIEKEYPAYLALKEKHERIQKEAWEQLLKRNS